LGPFQIFRKFAEIFTALGAPLVSLTPVANGRKKFLSGKFIYFVLTPLGSRDKFFRSSSLSVVSIMILFPLFSTGVVDTGGAP